MLKSNIDGYQVLVLNRLWQAVNIIGIKRAFSLMVQESAHVIHTSDGSYEVLSVDDWIEYSISHPSPDGKDSIRTINFSLRIPKILLLKDYDRMPRKEVKFSRVGVFERDDYRCQYCGSYFSEKNLNLDHVIPRDQGGNTSWENIVTSCIPCNSTKGNRMPHQANMHLMKKPAKPAWRPFVSVNADPEYHKHWQNFIYASQKS
jgi:5-methylcytosine-specific restriction endonuclease McrA